MVKGSFSVVQKWYECKWEVEIRVLAFASIQTRSLVLRIEQNLSIAGNWQLHSLRQKFPKSCRVPDSNITIGAGSAAGEIS
jgi:hypothetical protein